jgi:hypothetical protein
MKPGLRNRRVVPEFTYNNWEGGGGDEDILQDIFQGTPHLEQAPYGRKVLCAKQDFGYCDFGSHHMLKTEPNIIMK